MIKLTDKQKEAWGLLCSQATRVLLVGGSRSGKTFILVVAMLLRAAKFPGSRHLICRFRFAHAKASIWLDTLPAVVSLLQIKGVQWVETDHYIKLANGSEVWIDGLDEKQRVDKILGREYATIYFNESSQISWGAVDTVLSRLAQRVNGCVNKAFFDLNPGSKGHWTYKLWFRGEHPQTGNKIKDFEKYVRLQMNPVDNKDNVAEGYLTILESMGPSRRRRFLLGEYSDDAETLVFPASPGNYYLWDAFDEWCVRVGRSNVRLTAGLDIGFEDADAFAIIAYCPGQPERWLIWEYKARRQGISDLAEAVKTGLAFTDKLIKDGKFTTQLDYIYTDTGGGGKKITYDLAMVYGLPVGAAYKADKQSGIEQLREDIETCIFKMPEKGILAGECERTVWTKDDETDQTIRKIDDAQFHPDLIDAILYAMRPVWYYETRREV